jgi:phospholipase C
LSKGLVIPRRNVLKGLGAAAGLAACGPDGRPSARPPTPEERGRIDTIVICMMENRSFDHVFGSLSLLEGRTDIDGLLPGMANPDLDDNLVPIGPNLAPCMDPDPPHGWTSSRTQLDGGTNLGFVRAFQESHGLSAPTSIPMSYQVREQQPISYALADQYALCQRWFSSLLTSTWPNRLYFHAAQSQGIASNSLPPTGTYTCRTIWDQLTDAGVEWGYYYTDLPTLALFGRADWAERLARIEQFYTDASTGSLPQVVCVDPGAGYNDDHPPHHPMLGQLFLGSIYAALASSPHWERCLFLVTYDEAGGLFDHVVPGTMPDDFASEGFDQLGFRVPAFVAGPYVRNVVDDTHYDHTAALTFIQDHFGIDERLTKRNEASQDLSLLLDADRLARNEPEPPITLPVITRSEEEILEECSSLGGRTGQPELQRLVQDLFPSQDRTSELPSIARRAWQRAGDQGLWVPK